MKQKHNASHEMVRKIPYKVPSIESVCNVSGFLGRTNTQMSVLSPDHRANMKHPTTHVDKEKYVSPRKP